MSFHAFKFDLILYFTLLYFTLLYFTLLYFFSAERLTKWVFTGSPSLSLQGPPKLVASQLVTTMRSLLLVLTALCYSRATHYEQPPCQSDETSFQIDGTDSGVVCAPKCGAGDSCPQDTPTGTTVSPRCALRDSSGNKYCALTCLFGKCPDAAKCTRPTGAIVGYCAYQNTTIQHETLELRTASPSGTQTESVDVAWNISAACPSLCQPDPDYSTTSYCKHKDRGGCCVEVDPSWDKVPGYKHVEDFCDKLCMPDSPGKLAMCKPPQEFPDWAAPDPRDAVDLFYKANPSQCSDRINAQTWNEAYCK